MKYSTLRLLGCSINDNRYYIRKPFCFSTLHCFINVLESFEFQQEIEVELYDWSSRFSKILIDQLNSYWGSVREKNFSQFLVRSWSSTEFLQRLLCETRSLSLEIGRFWKHFHIWRFRLLRSNTRDVLWFIVWAAVAACASKNGCINNRNGCCDGPIYRGRQSHRYCQTFEYSLPIPTWISLVSWCREHSSICFWDSFECLLSWMEPQPVESSGRSYMEWPWCKIIAISLRALKSSF